MAETRKIPAACCHSQKGKIAESAHGQVSALPEGGGPEVVVAVDFSAGVDAQATLVDREYGAGGAEESYCGALQIPVPGRSRSVGYNPGQKVGTKGGLSAHPDAGVWLYRVMLLIRARSKLHRRPESSRFPRGPRPLAPGGQPRTARRDCESALTPEGRARDADNGNRRGTLGWWGATCIEARAGKTIPTRSGPPGTPAPGPVHTCGTRYQGLRACGKAGDSTVASHGGLQSM